MIRKFTLTNTLNENYSLNNLNSFGYNPTGLGVNFTNEYIGVNANFIQTTSALNRGQLNIRVLFGAINGKSYQGFQDFIRFINYQPLTLKYETEAGAYFRICNINELTKTEINNYNVIDEELILEFITPWFSYVESEIKKYEDQEGDGKIYIQAISGDYPTPTNLIQDPIITTIGEGTTSNNWYVTTGPYAWSVSTENQYVEGYNIAIINQNDILTGNVNVAAQNLYTKNISSQTIGEVYLLEFYFKSDRITEQGSDLEVTAYNSAEEKIEIYDVVDRYGRILNNAVIYYLKSVYSGRWVNCQIAYKPETSDEIIAKIRFNFQRNDSIFNYFTYPQLLETDSIPIEDTDAYYVYPYVYDDEIIDVNTNYYNINNESIYMGSSTGSPIEITVEAIANPVENPSWELWRGSNIIQSDKYFLTIQPGYKLVVSSFPEDQYARLISPDGKYTNAYQNQDLTKTNFITIPTGTTTLIFDVGDAQKSFRMREEHVIV